jgi:hypothetical protein
VLIEYRWLVYRLSHTFLAIDISGIGLPNEIYPPNGKEQSVPTRRFQSWKDAESYLRGLGASDDSMTQLSAHLNRGGFGVLTILSSRES